MLWKTKRNENAFNRGCKKFLFLLGEIKAFLPAERFEIRLFRLYLQAQSLFFFFSQFSFIFSLLPDGYKAHDVYAGVSDSLLSYYFI